HYHCMAYVLNLIVGGAFKTNVIPLPVKKLHTFINMIGNSPKQMDKLKEYFRIEAFFDPRYKKTAYGNMSREDILQPIRTAMINYEESDTSYISQNTIQPVMNELDIYFDYNTSGDEVTPLEWWEWWKVHATEYPLLAKLRCKE
ncbi:18000_t:CDS:2, partial [Funneliformis geosporum]